MDEQAQHVDVPQYGVWKKTTTPPDTSRPVGEPEHPRDDGHTQHKAQSATPTVMTDIVGHSPTTTDRDGQGPTVSSAIKTATHTFTTHDAVGMLTNLGVARTQRSIERYCNNGSLDCFYDDDIRQNYITPESIERLAAYLKEIAARKGAMQPLPVTTVHEEPDATPDDSPTTAPDTSERRRPTEADDAEIRALQVHVKELEAANRDLEIASRVKDEVIKRSDADREKFNEERMALVGMIDDRSRLVGSFEAKLQALEAPKTEEVKPDQ
jgi:hypothetical protein